MDIMLRRSLILLAASPVAFPLPATGQDGQARTEGQGQGRGNGRGRGNGPNCKGGGVAQSGPNPATAPAVK